MYDFDVIIIGAGPTGTAAALRLLQRRPELAGRVLVLDKAVFPRSKLCGGGVTRAADAALSVLGVTSEVPTLLVTSAEFRFATRIVNVRAGRVWPDYIFRIVRRDEFDLDLLQRARRRGAQVHDGEEVTAVSVSPTAVTLTTTRGRYTARVAIAADGANSFVRRHVGLNHPRCLGAASEILLPAPSSATSRARGNGHHALFDFGPASTGFQGYYWEFPTMCGDTAMVSRGVADARLLTARADRSVRSELHRRVAESGTMSDYEGSSEGAALRWFDPRAPQSTDRIVFAGDAAGAEPLLDEGISSAIEFGTVAADAVIRALASGDVSFASYQASLLRSALGRTLVAKLGLARRFYARPARWQYVAMALPARRVARVIARATG